MKVMIKEKASGEVFHRDIVDAREILAISPDLYEQVSEAPVEATPVENVQAANLQDEASRMRNPVGDKPLTGNAQTTTGVRGAAASRNVEREMLESQTNAELRRTAENEKVELGNAHSKNEIIGKIMKARAEKARTIVAPN